MSNQVWCNCLMTSAILIATTIAAVATAFSILSYQQESVTYVTTVVELLNIIDGNEVMNITEVNPVPSNTLYLAMNWSQQVDPLIYFTDANQANLRANSLAQMNNSQPIVILVSPGSYGGISEISSFTCWVATGGRGSAFFGSISWSPTLGLNSNFTNTTETLTLKGLDSSAFTSFVFYATSKTIIEISDFSCKTSCFFSTNAPFNVTKVSIDNLKGGQFSVVSSTVSMTNSAVGVAGSSNAFLFGTVYLSNVVITGPTQFNPERTYTIIKTSVSDTVSISSANQINTPSFSQSSLNAIMVNSGTIADLRSSVYNSLGTYNTFTGVELDRNFYSFNVTSVNGSNSVNFPIGYINTPLSIEFTQTNGPASTLKLTSVSNTGITWSDPTGGGSFTVIVKM